MFPQFPIRAIGANRVSLHGAFRPNDAGTGTMYAETFIENDSVKGIYDEANKVGYEVSRDSAGLWTLTFAQAFKELLYFNAFVREAAGTATIIQGGDYSAANRTLKFRVLQGGAAGAGRTKNIQFDILSARVVSKTKFIDLGIDFHVNGTPPTYDATAGGWAFDNDNELANFSFKVPDDWDGASDMYLVIKWHPESGSVVGKAETIIWETDYFCAAEGGAIDAGAAASVDTTYTAAAALTDKLLISTATTMDYNHLTSPLVKGQRVYMGLSRDKGTDTYVGDAVVVGVELQYTAALQPLKVVDGLPAASDEPYLRRINGATNAGFQLVWPAGNVDPVQLPPIIYPADFDGGVDMYVKLQGLMAGAADTPVITCGSYEGVGTVINDNTAAFSASYAEKSATLAHGDFGAHPNGLNVILTPGAHNTDALYLMGGSLEYTNTETGSTFAVADLAADADNEIMFEAVFRTGSATK